MGMLIAMDGLARSLSRRAWNEQKEGKATVNLLWSAQQPIAAEHLCKLRCQQARKEGQDEHAGDAEGEGHERNVEDPGRGAGGRCQAFRKKGRLKRRKRGGIQLLDGVSAAQRSVEGLKVPREGL